MHSFISSRRALLGAFGVATAAAAVKVRAADLPPDPQPGAEFVFEEFCTLDAGFHIGATPFGQRNRIGITGGHFEGKRIQGKILPGGADWQLVRADGVVSIEAEYMIEASDGTLIHVLNRGIVSIDEQHKTPPYIRAAPVFEAPIGPHDWLNKSLFLSTITPMPEGQAPAVRVRIFRVT